MTETEIEPVETVLGRLQRGRGSGYLDALSEDAVSVQQDVIKCVTKDPRWDSQVEARSTYYANLMIALNLGIDPLVTHLFNDKDYVDDDENRTGLTAGPLTG